METKFVIVPEINEEHRVQIKNTYYFCIYLTCILHYVNKLNLFIFLIFNFMRNGVHGLFGGGTG
jgi:hypothetical protein